MSNENSEKVKKEFDKIAAEYVEEVSEKDLTSAILSKFCDFLPASGKILDIGCGGGNDTKKLLDRGYSVLGLDFSEEMLKLARVNAPGAEYKSGNFLEIDLPSNEFVGVWCMRVFHLVPLAEQGVFLSKIADVLSPDGYLYISAIRDTFDHDGMDEKNRFRKWLKEDSFKELLRKHGFEILEFNLWEGKGMELFCKKK